MSLVIFVKLKNGSFNRSFIDSCYSLSPHIIKKQDNEFFIEMGKINLEKVIVQINNLNLLPHKIVTFGLAYNRLAAYIAALTSFRHPQLIRKKTNWGYLSWVEKNNSSSFIQTTALKALHFLLSSKTLKTLINLGINSLSETNRISMETLKDFLGEDAKIIYLLNNGIFPYATSPLPLEFVIYKSIPPDHNFSDLLEYIKIACQELSLELANKNLGCRTIFLNANMYTGVTLSEKEIYSQPKNQWGIFENTCLSFFKSVFKGHYEDQLLDFSLQVKEYEAIDGKQLDIYDLQPARGQSLDHVKSLPSISICPHVSRREQILSLYDPYRQGRN
ncbi:MAG: hypothetical protein APF76_13285 [Desulfitibacter sp. BRH_c19]|nr:MAG: hypothetical protein APF76_13285 [Desulfitibacter sp. BRH_c19]